MRELQSVARDAGQEQPLLVAVDQEGGRVARLKEPVDDVAAAPRRGPGRLRGDGAPDGPRPWPRSSRPAASATTSRPCVDVDTNPRNPVIGDRSFGDDPDLVGRLGAAMIRGFQENGVVACAKHFPGHGDTDVDSHLDLPSVEHSRSRLDDVELRPFRKAIEAGVATVMASHLLVREIDDALPATLSPRVVTGLLREELGYAGVVVTDALEMKAVAEALDAGRSRGDGGEGGLRSAGAVQRPRRAGRGHGEPDPGARGGGDPLQGGRGGRRPRPRAEGAVPGGLPRPRPEAGPAGGGAGRAPGARRVDRRRSGIPA